jgi:hypothetical protein
MSENRIEIMSREVTLPELEGYIGKTTTDFCNTGFVDPLPSHCAHFVSHVLGIRVGELCGNLAKNNKNKTRGMGATIRVNELYNGLAFKGPWEQRPPGYNGLLIFVISPRYMRNNFMQEVIQKHVGIYFAGNVFHYGNTQDKVACDSVEDFHKKFKRQYSKDVELYYGIAP